MKKEAGNQNFFLNTLLLLKCNKFSLETLAAYAKISFIPLSYTKLQMGHSFIDLQLIATLTRVNIKSSNIHLDCERGSVWQV